MPTYAYLRADAEDDVVIYANVIQFLITFIQADIEKIVRFVILNDHGCVHAPRSRTNMTTTRFCG